MKKLILPETEQLSLTVMGTPKSGLSFSNFSSSFSLIVSKYLSMFLDSSMASLNLSSTTAFSNGFTSFILLIYA